MESQSITSRLKRLGEADPDRRLFGSDMHYYYACPPLCETVTSVFESKAGIILPTGYREYMLHVSGGGAGPGYGLFFLRAALIDDTDDKLRLEQTMHCMFPDELSQQWKEANLPSEPEPPSELPDFIPEEFRRQWAKPAKEGKDASFVRFYSEPMWELAGALDLLQKPFPFSEPYTSHEEADKIDWDHLEPEEAEQKTNELWESFQFDRYRHGTVPLCSYGHDMIAVLVVTGPQRNQVWLMDKQRQVLQPFGGDLGRFHRGAETAPEAPLTFEQWYIHWLSAAEKYPGPEPEGV
ncbi:MAG: hypothetical protein QNK37_09985 [Acidobacteriota bacterium]|nr:hypothetical protein [Acidobacteriota bacterium]